MQQFIDFPSDEILHALNKLMPESQAVWGTMTAQHMVEHLLLVVELSKGKFDIAIITPPEKVEKIKRIMLYSDAPLKRDFAAPFLPDGLQTLNFESLEASKNALLKEIENYLRFWQMNPNAIFNHPVFGQLTADDWNLFHKKHFTHHFTQFGLL